MSDPTNRTDRITLDAAPEATFADLETRTIRGLAVPAGEVARSGGRSFRFASDSITFGDRTPLLMFHSLSNPVGRLTAKTWSQRGLEVTFAVSKTEAGDEALVLAADGVLGLSVGVDIDPTGKGARMGSDDVLDVTAAVGREISLTPVPAFAGSRVESVSMHDDDEGQVTVTETPEVTPVTLNLDGLGEQIAAALTAAAPQPQPLPIAQVSEPAIYRFDGGRGRFDFSTDLIAGSKGDGEALARATDFVRETFAVTQSNVATLNPTRQRPDMYVDQREYLTPLWSAVNKGTLADNTPFVFPKFNSSSGLVANHTEGVEPTPGAFTATSQTVTPSAVSGKVEITRETWDQGGNPQVSGLIFRQMVRAWGEALEAYVVALLEANAASITDIALTTAAVDSALDADLINAFVTLQYQRGGFRFSEFAVQVDLFRKLASAVDDAGRALFPQLAPSNAGGTAAPRFTTIDVHGVQAYPAWALAATGTASANSWLFDRESVHGWASAPQRLDFQYRVAYVDVALWGYKAAAISDFAGIRQVTYDPAA